MNLRPEMHEQEIEKERYEVLEQVKDILEPVVTVLGFIWLLLLVAELIWGATQFSQALVWAIWAIFLIDFLIRLVIVPHKLRFLRSNWLTVLSLFVPALRLFRLASLVRIMYATRTVRSLQLLRMVSSVNRGMKALRAHMRRRQVGYILALTTLVTVVSAAGMYFFEQGAAEGGFLNYWDALYWTGMMMTTLGSAYWPTTGEGRVLAFLLALYAFTMFGYLTATLSTFFIGREAENSESELSTRYLINDLKEEISALRQEIQRLSEKPLE